MPRTRKPHSATDEQLTSPQLLAVAALVAGDTMTASAQAAGVDRSTVYRWLRDDFDFQAAVNAGRHELREEIRGKLFKLAVDAADAVTAAVRGGDARTGLAVLRELHILNGGALVVGSQTPDDLRDDADYEARSDSHRRVTRSLFI